jgi:putative transposase
MSRLSCITVPGLPHHVTQRGNRRERVFMEEGDYALYRDLMTERCAANSVACCAWCLMPNHVHLILTGIGSSSRPPRHYLTFIERSLNTKITFTRKFCRFLHQIVRNTVYLYSLRIVDDQSPVPVNRVVIRGQL